MHRATKPFQKKYEAETRKRKFEFIARLSDYLAWHHPALLVLPEQEALRRASSAILAAQEKSK